MFLVLVGGGVGGGGGGACGTRRVVTSVQSLRRPLQEVYGLTKFRLESARKRCCHLGFSTVHSKNSLGQGVAPFCVMRFAANSAFSQGSEPCARQAICKIARCIAGTFT